MVGYRDELYVFGGEVGFSNGVETPLWIYSIKVLMFNAVTVNKMKSSKLLYNFSPTPGGSIRVQRAW